MNLKSEKNILYSYINQEMSDDIIDDLKEMIINWLSLDDKAKELSAAAKDLTTEKKQFESYILDYMTKLNKPIIDTSSGKLVKDDKKTKKALKEDMVVGALTEITGNKDRAAEMTKIIFDKRPDVENTRLKRIKLPVKNSKSKNVV